MYVYHRKPSKFVGHILYPLNQLKSDFPDIYAHEADKYKGREMLLEMSIPILNCLWNDVLHFTPVHPAEVFKYLHQAGGVSDPDIWKKREWLKVDVHKMGFTAHNTVIYKNQQKGYFGEPFPASDFTPFDATLLATYRNLPQATKVYYRQQKEAGKRPLMYVAVPHILHLGTLDIREVELIGGY